MIYYLALLALLAFTALIAGNWAIWQERHERSNTFIVSWTCTVWFLLFIVVVKGLAQ